MQLVILGLLLSGPLSLYDIRKRFTAGISVFYSASFGSIQRALAQLIAQGAVTVSPDPDSPRGKKLHTITSNGRRRWRDEMLAPIPPGTDAETLSLAKVFLMGHLADAEDRRAVLDGIRERTASALAELRARATEVDALTVPEEHRRVFDGQRATLAYGLRAHEHMLAWVDGLSEAER